MAVTAVSSSGQEISKSSRMETCDADSIGPIWAIFPARSSSTVASTRAFSVTTCRARRRITGSSSDPAASSWSGVTSRSAGTPSTRAACSQERRRAPYSPVAWAWVTRVSTSSSARSAAATSSGTACACSDRQSRKTAWPAWASSAAIWSITPTGAPTTSFSARWPASASSVRDSVEPVRSATARATAPSSAALEDSPPPTGTSESTMTSSPGTATPASRSAHTTPSGYADQPDTTPGARSATAISGAVPSCFDQHRSWPSARRPTATSASRSMANGSTKPSL